MPEYRGRFAPSPTGPLHFGSLFAAVISYLDAKSNQGKWLVRIEDIDPPRESPIAKQHIVDTLVSHGLHWDEDISYQSERSNFYESSLKQLAQSGHTYFCPCSRKYLTENHNQHHPDCRSLNIINKQECATRFDCTGQTWQWHDLIQGNQSFSLKEDFVLKRKDGYYAYQLAVVCDDIAQNISHVIRGYYLLDSTPMQLTLYEALDQPAPFYGHFPVIVNTSLQKLSKQNLATPVDNKAAIQNLRQILAILNIPVNQSLSMPETILAEATSEWSLTALKNRQSIKANWL